MIFFKNLMRFRAPSRNLFFEISAVILLLAAGPAHASGVHQTDVIEESAPGPDTPAAAPSIGATSSAPAGIKFEPALRAVSNWRSEAKDNLELSQEMKTKLSSGAGCRMARVA